MEWKATLRRIFKLKGLQGGRELPVWPADAEAEFETLFTRNEKVEERRAGYR
jgi:hypothetical protein